MCGPGQGDGPSLPAAVLLPCVPYLTEEWISHSCTPGLPCVWSEHGPPGPRVQRVLPPRPPPPQQAPRRAADGRCAQLSKPAWGSLSESPLPGFHDQGAQSKHLSAQGARAPRHPRAKPNTCRPTCEQRCAVSVLIAGIRTTHGNGRGAGVVPSKHVLTGSQQHARTLNKTRLFPSRTPGSTGGPSERPVRVPAAATARFVRADLPWAPSPSRFSWLHGRRF